MANPTTPPKTPANPGPKPGDIKPTPASAKPVETKTEIKKTEPVDDWAALPAATVEPEDSKFSRGLKVDILKEVHESIRKDVEEAFKTPGVYVLKVCATPEQAVRFTAAAKRYARYRPAGQLTVRGGPTKVDPKVVRFNAKVMEKRAPNKDAEEGKAKATNK